MEDRNDTLTNLQKLFNSVFGWNNLQFGGVWTNSLDIFFVCFTNSLILENQTKWKVECFMLSRWRWSVAPVSWLMSFVFIQLVHTAHRSNCTYFSVGGPFPPSSSISCVRLEFRLPCFCFSIFIIIVIIGKVKMWCVQNFCRYFSLFSKQEGCSFSFVWQRLHWTIFIKKNLFHGIFSSVFLGLKVVLVFWCLCLCVSFSFSYLSEMF